jgi:hypothetical protein
MKEEKITDRKADGSAAMPFDTNEFIGQLLITDSREDMLKPVPADSPAATPDDIAESTAEKPAKRKRMQPIDYERLFLLRNELHNRQGLYISRENYEVLQTLVRAIRGERLSVSGLADNIISHHIELYGDEINRIYDENSRKPVKKKQ